jgi:hypothetical protein
MSFFSHRFGKHKGCLTKRALDGWDSVAFLSFFYIQTESCSRSFVHAHPPLTQTVGRLLRLIINILAHIKLPKENRLTDEKVEKRNY